MPSYKVPALFRASEILRLISEHPNKLKLIDLSKMLEVNKSSMFSMLTTMENLGWVSKNSANAYKIGDFMGMIGSAYLRQFDLLQLFNQKVEASKEIVGETFQLARLEGREVFYLGKAEAESLIRIVTDPGMRYPAHATALGKAMLSTLPETELADLYEGNKTLKKMTVHTIDQADALFDHLRAVRQNGFAIDLQEATLGVCCVAAPIFNGQRGKASAAVSVSMPLHQWETKKESAIQEICKLAKELSSIHE